MYTLSKCFHNFIEALKVNLTYTGKTCGFYEFNQFPRNLVLVKDLLQGDPQKHFRKC